MIQALDTWAHVNRWHDRPLENGFLAGGLLVLAMFLPPFPDALLILAVSIAAATAGAGVPLRAWVRAMTVPSVFLVLGVLPMLLTVRISTGAADAGLVVGIHQEGLATTVHTGLRALAATASLILLGLTTPVPAQIGVLRRLRVPTVLLDLMALTYRLLFLLDSIAMRMIAAQVGRLGYRTVRIGFRSGALAIAGLFSRTLARAQAMERGLSARGYDGDLAVLDTFRKPNPRRLATIVLAHSLILLFELARRLSFRA